MASITSTLVASLLGERRTRSYAASINATSHWVWGDEAKYRRCTDVPHTVVGYAIHHACSVFWATGYEALMASRKPPHPLVGAGAVALVAYVVDYHCIPDRLTPGFEGHLRGRDMVATYGAFAAGLAATTLLRRDAGR